MIFKPRLPQGHFFFAVFEVSRALLFVCNTLLALSYLTPEGRGNGR